MVPTLVTGASGFVGRALVAELLARGIHARGAVRGAGTLHPGIDRVAIGEVDSRTDWHEALAGIGGVVHLAARVHVMHETVGDPLAAFRTANTEGTLNLARQAAEAGVCRFAFVSTIKVNGEGRNTPYTESDPASPQDPYAISKWEAEEGLRDIAARTGMEVVILRPPLIYGPGVGGNFLRLMRAVDKGWPLPLGAVDNRRSLIYLGNLVDALITCLAHPAAANKTFLLSDTEDVSTPGLVRRLAAALHRPARLISVPPSLLRIAGIVSGKRQAVDRLLGSLTIDGGANWSKLSWSPPISMETGLAETAAWYRINN